MTRSRAEAAGAGQGAGRDAAGLMEPLHAVVGATQSCLEAAQRMARHRATAAPVLRSGRVLGIVTRQRLDDAVRFGLGEESVAAIVTPRVPRVSPATPEERIACVARGTAPAVLVRDGAGRILGLVLRDRIGHAPPPAGAPGRRAMALWAGAPARRVLASAGRVGRETGIAAHLVGGGARDLAMHRTPGDLDLVVTGDVARFARRLAGRLSMRLTRHARFATASLSRGALRVDVARARREWYATPASLPQVEPGTLSEDLHRRDITINSMAILLDARGPSALRDELGGLEDLRRGLLRVPHRLTFIEDPTRAYRIARFAERFGMRPHRETRIALRLALRMEVFDRLTPARRWNEFSLICREPRPWKVLRRMDRWDLLGTLVSGVRIDAQDARVLGRLARGLDHGPLGRARLASPDHLHLAILAAMSPPRERPIALARTGIVGERARAMLGTRSAGARLVRSLRAAPAPGRVVDACERAGPFGIAWAWCLGDATCRHALTRYLDRDRHVRSLLTGEDLKAMGVVPGPAFRRILSALRKARIEGTCRSRESERLLARRMAVRGDNLTVEREG